MTLYSLPIYDIGYASTNNPSGFNSNGGFHFVNGSDTITKSSGAVVNTVKINDLTDNFFDDDAGTNQTLSGQQTINGTLYPHGTIIESEYVMEVQDAFGTNYGLQFISLNNDAFTIHAFAIYGPMPPLDTPLTVVNHYDNVSGYLQYPAAAPPCFGPGTRIDTADGPVPVEWLRAGDLLALLGGGYAPLRLSLSSPRWTAGPDRASPVRIAAGALGKGVPRADLILSPQHRVWIRELGGLVPAKALAALPGVCHAHDIAWINYHHLVLDHHGLLLANGLPCESLWPGEVALAALPDRSVRRIHAIMGPHPRPAGRFLTVAEARRGFARVGLTPTRGG